MLPDDDNTYDLAFLYAESFWIDNHDGRASREDLLEAERVLVEYSRRALQVLGSTSPTTKKLQELLEHVRCDLQHGKFNK